MLNEMLFKPSILLNDSKPIQAGSEHTTLKNLGSWLGVIMLARKAVHVQWAQLGLDAVLL